ncbi:MAG: UvrD-helicase domain-containing protein [Flavobacteriales bacterium]
MTPQLTLHEASAGSGKTYTLVKNYLSICLDPKQAIDVFKRILAITFTNKAAKEMQDRIIEKLHDFSSEKTEDQFLADYFCRKFQFSNEELKARSFSVLQSILHHYSQFSVSTIDKFMLKVLKSIQHELGMHEQLEISLDFEDWLSASIDDLYVSLGQDEAKKQFVINKLKSNLLEEKSWRLEYQFSTIAKTLLEEDYRTHFGKFVRTYNLEEFSGFDEQLNLKYKDLDAMFLPIQSEYQALIKEYDLARSDFSGRYSCPIYKVFSSHLPVRKVLPKDFESLLNRFEKNNFFRKADLKDQKFIDAQQGLEHFTQKHKNSIHSLLFFNYLYQKIANQLSDLQLDKLLSTSIKKQLDEQRLFPLAFINSLLGKYIKKGEIPMLFLKLGERYEHIFIDEFQDTSRAQWANLLPLIEHVLSKNQAVHLIGDAKQSIYRFRGGDVRILLDLKENPNRDFYEVAMAPALESNWRSGKTIVDFNNKLFSDILIPEHKSKSYQSIYKTAAQKVEIQDESYVEINTKVVDKEELEEETLALLLEKIRYSKRAGFEYGDMAVLLKNNKSIALISQFLLEHEIPFVDQDSLLVSSDDQVDVLIKILSLKADPTNEIDKVKVFNFFYQKLNQDIDNQQFESWFEKHKNLSIEALFSVIEPNWKSYVYTNFFEFLEAIVQGFDFQRSIYLIEFLNRAHQSLTKGCNSAQDFVETYEKYQTKWKVDFSHVNGIQLMTIHKSKGLEFPVVFLPFLFTWSDWHKDNTQFYPLEGLFPDLPYANFGLTKPMQRLPKETLGVFYDIFEQAVADAHFDFINNLYVACTRASRQLVFINVYEGTGKTKANIQSESGKLHHLLTKHFVPEEYWASDELQVLSYGNRQMKFEKKEDEKDKEIEKPEDLISASSSMLNWNSRIQIAEKQEFEWAFGEELSAQDQGNHLHQILAGVNSISDLDSAINNYFSKRWFSSELKEKWKTQLESMLNLPNLSPYFQSGLKVWNERAWMCENGDLLRPDRVVELENGHLVVIDYKTGAEKKEHQDQVKTYAKQLESAGHTVDKKALVYIENQLVKFI